MRILYLDLGGLPPDDVDPAGGSHDYMTPAVTVNNFNYRLNPDDGRRAAAGPGGRDQDERHDRRAAGLHPMTGPRREPMMDGRRSERATMAGDERGMALVLALMVILVLTVIAAALMANVNTETKIAGYRFCDAQSLTVAEAGVQEAMLRNNRGRARRHEPAQRAPHLQRRLGLDSGSGGDTTSLRRLQPVGSYLPQMTPNKNPTVLSIAYKRRGNTIPALRRRSESQDQHLDRQPHLGIPVDGPQQRRLFAASTPRSRAAG